MNQLSSRVDQLSSRAASVQHATRDAGGGGIVLFIVGAFCALWAQNTGRNPWLWFILGALFSVITVIALLVKNSDDLKSKKKTFNIQDFREQ